MSYKSYVQHIAQKYRLAVAISVLKEKPQNISIEKYVEHLRNKIIEDRTHDDVSVCSDDFDMDNNTDKFNNAINNNDFNHINNNNDDFNNDNETQDSVTILKDFQFDLTTPMVNEIKNVDSENQISLQKQNPTHPQTPQPTNEIINLQDNAYNYLTQDITYDVNATFCPSQFLNDAQDMDEILDEQFRDRDIDKTSNNKSNYNNEVKPNTYDSQATILYTLHGFTENHTHVSQSQFDDITIPENLIKNKNYNNLIAKEKSMNIVNDFEMCKVTNAQNLTQLETINENINNDFKMNEGNFKTSHKPQEMNELKETKTNICKINQINETELNPTEVFSKNINDATNNAAISENINENTNNTAFSVNINENTNTLAILNENVTNEELASPSQELIPFKVIEELSKVKSYLNKKAERRMSNDGSIDSGYRSDGQSKSSFRSSLQLSVTWLNQSAHCLFSYILQCPVVATTQHITNEISQVLGQLIDRLHDEEKYPSFLDELLENVDFLLQDVFGGDNSNKDVWLKKDEEIQRIFLLNTSTHIQKYTIEKITNILEDIQSKLNNSDMYEITNIDEVENTTYIFHILEVILKRYMKSKLLITESISNSQNEFPKKSSITNIWRKKWNPKFKEDETLEIAKKKCVLIHCNKVLNNFVVGCMEEYSLVAFAALQCFNILQS